MFAQQRQRAPTDGQAPPFLTPPARTAPARRSKFKVAYEDTGEAAMLTIADESYFTGGGAGSWPTPFLLLAEGFWSVLIYGLLLALVKMVRAARLCPTRRPAAGWATPLRWLFTHALAAAAEPALCAGLVRARSLSLSCPLPATCLPACLARSSSSA